MADGHKVRYTITIKSHSLLFGILSNPSIHTPSRHHPNCSISFAYSFFSSFLASTSAACAWLWHQFVQSWNKHAFNLFSPITQLT